MISSLAFRVVHVFVLDNLGEHACNLLIQQRNQLVVHVLVQLVGLAELVSQRLRGVTFVDYDSLHLVLANIDIDIELGIGFVNAVIDVDQLLVNQILWVVTLVLFWRFLLRRLITVPIIMVWGLLLVGHSSHNRFWWRVLAEWWLVRVSAR